MAFEGVCVETQWVFWVYLVFLGLLGFFGFKWVLVGLFAFSDLSMLAFLCVCAYGYEGTKV